MQGAGCNGAATGSRAATGFASTHWSVVVAAGDSHSPQSAAALESLCRTYWFPLYACVRRQGYSPEEAQDLTQAFFARLLEKKYLKHANPDCGRFRTFLLTSLKHFVVSEWRKTERQKRGGGTVVVPWNTEDAEQCYASEPADELTPERIFEKRWAIALMQRVLARLRDEYATADDGRLFEQLKGSVWGEALPKPYAEIATELGLTEGAVKSSAHRLRQRCREVLREEITQTVARPEDVDDELRHLVELFSG
jgi:RNA polymerase sigma-70 factor (ECF subfamily)